MVKSMPSALRAPVTWLASYPRSGNTLLRIILKHCFGQTSQSVYEDAELSAPRVAALVGREEVGDDPADFIVRARRSGRSLYVKTHEMPPPDRHPSIYVVRDGRSAAVSHAYYVREILGRSITLAEVIEGGAGHHWSHHVQAWMRRPGMLLVRYEDLRAGNEGTLKEISDFIGKPQLQGFDISFAALHALSPAFFRSGSDSANILEMDGGALRLFDRLHGETLHALGYGRIRSGATGVRARA